MATAPDRQQLPRNAEMEERYMRQALEVARAALEVGEVPVGCVLVLRDPDEECGDGKVKPSGQIEDGANCSCGVVVSHGANQVNATRDATRHAELVAIDRMLTGGLSSDRQRLPPRILARSAHGRIPEDNPLLREATGGAGGGGADVPSPTSSSGADGASACTINGWNDAWINVPDDRDHWKNGYGWGSGRLYDADIFKRCDLYVTCEPCIMVSERLAIGLPHFLRVQIDECFPPEVLFAY